MPANVLKPVSTGSLNLAPETASVHHYHKQRPEPQPGPSHVRVPRLSYRYIFDPELMWQSPSVDLAASPGVEFNVPLGWGLG